MSTTTDPELERLQDDRPGWKLWRSDGGSWMATRRGHRPEVPTEFFSRRGHLIMTLMEDGPRELADALNDQAAIEDELDAFGSLDHGVEHPIIPACPISCLGLTRATEDALATITQRPDGDYDVVQVGERLLWDEAQAALMQWLASGRPGRDAYRMVVTPTEQKVVLLDR